MYDFFLLDENNLKDSYTVIYKKNVLALSSFIMAVKEAQKRASIHDKCNPSGSMGLIMAF